MSPKPNDSKWTFQNLCLGDVFVYDGLDSVSTPYSCETESVHTHSDAVSGDDNNLTPEMEDVGVTCDFKWHVDD